LPDTIVICPGHGLGGIVQLGERALQRLQMDIAPSGGPGQPLKGVPILNQPLQLNPTGLNMKSRTDRGTPAALRLVI